MQGVEAAAECDGLRSKLQELAAASRCRAEEVDEAEGLQVVALWHDLTQRPLLQAVLVPVVLDVKELEALHHVDGAAQVIEHRVDHFGGSAAELLANENVRRGEQSFAHYIVHKCVMLILTEALVNLLIVELN